MDLRANLDPVQKLRTALPRIEPRAVQPVAVAITTLNALGHFKKLRGKSKCIPVLN